MNDTKDVTARDKQATQASDEQEPAIRPPVDIFEDATGITLQADLPGVSRDGLEVHVDSDSLSIAGNMHVPVPEDTEALFADVRSTRYLRSFSLSSELDRDNIEASLKDGVLILRISKREEHKPRKIEVRTD